MEIAKVIMGGGEELKMRRIWSGLGLLCLLLGAGSGAVFGQGLPKPLEPSNVSKVVLYDHLFHHVQHLEERAAERESFGLDASGLRGHYRERAGLSAAEDAALKQVALASNAAVKEQDRQAKMVIDALRARHPDGRIPIGESVPEPPQELLEMQQARNRMVQASIDQLQTRMGVERFARFDAFVDEYIRSKVWTPDVVTPAQQ